MKSDLIVAHNASFDAKFINRELELSGLDPIQHGWMCTMMEYRARGAQGSSALAAICGRIGISRRGKNHGALEDAWLAMQVYFWLLDCRLHALNFPGHFQTAPENYREPFVKPKRKRQLAVEAAARTEVADSNRSKDGTDPVLPTPTLKRRGRPRKQ